MKSIDPSLVEEPLTLEEIHQVMLGLLKNVISICKKHGIRYFIAYGSLIGTVRHQGYIPWDDDLDIMMLRPDYDKFCSICNQYVNGHGDYALLNRDNTKSYPNNISRFCDMRYKMIRHDNEPTGGAGAFIDIYPLDGLGNHELVIKYILKPLKLLNLVLMYVAQSNQIFIRPYSKKIKLAGCVLLPFGRLMGGNFFYKILRKIGRHHSTKHSKFVGVYVWEPVLDYYPIEYFEDTIEGNFEGVTVSMPKEYDKILCHLYGDYMHLPPIEDRKPHHAYDIYRKKW